MPRRLFRLAVSTCVLALAACASAPTHFYTLLPPEQPTTTNAAAPGFAIDLALVTVPAEVDQAAWVVRTGPGQVAVLDGERWAAPLADELRAALADELTRRLGARETEQTASRTGEPVYRIRVRVRRFESAPGQYALIEADWSVAGREADRALGCSSHVSQPVEPGYAALALGHQRAVVAVANDIAAAVKSVAAGHPRCPPDQ